MRRAISRYPSVVWRDAKGVTSIEYAVLALFVCAAVAIPVFQLGASLQGLFAIPPLSGQASAASPSAQPSGGSSGASQPPSSGSGSGSAPADHDGDH